MTRVLNGLDELESLLGQEIGVSDWHEITQERVNAFADATDDHQWIHIDPERAKAGPFGGTIAHGFLTLSLLPMFSAEIYTVTGLRMAVNYGLDKVRFPAPVPVGSRLRGRSELIAVVRDAKGARATVRVTVEIEGSERPACVAESLALLVP